MSKRNLVALAVVLCALAVATSLYYSFLIDSQRLRSGMGIEALWVSNIGWSVSLARADFNITVTELWPQSTTIIDHVEVNGTEVDAYPENSPMKLGETVLLKVYCPYQHGATYKFKFLTKSGCAYYCISEAPPG